MPRGGRWREKLIENIKQMTYVLEALTSSTLRSKVDHVGVVVEEVEDIYSLLGDKSPESMTGQRSGNTRLAELIMETVEKIGVYVIKNADGQLKSDSHGSCQEL